MSYPASSWARSARKRGGNNANHRGKCTGKVRFIRTLCGARLNDKSVLPLLLGARRLVGACLRAAALAQPLAAMSAPGR